MWVDLHIHTKGSDGWGTPEQIVQTAIDRGLDGFAITDHHRTQTKEGDEVAQLARKRGLVVFRGAEYSSADGHILIYGVALEFLDLGFYMPMQKVIDRVRTHGGVAIPAHPYHLTPRMEHPLRDRVILLQKIPAIEVRNGQREIFNQRENERAIEAARKRCSGRRGIGGSDAHDPRYVGCCFTQFSQWIETDADLVQALLRGHYHARRNLRALEDLSLGPKLDILPTSAAYSAYATICADPPDPGKEINTDILWRH